MEPKDVRNASEGKIKDAEHLLQKLHFLMKYLEK